MCRPSYASASLLIVAAASLAGPSTSAAARQPDLGTWLEKDLTPFVSEQLTTHPRFKGELVRFVVFKDGNPAPRSDALAVSLRDRLADAVINVPGVRVGWTYTASDTSREQSGTAIDCSKDAVHYYIGLEVSAAGSGQYKVDLRALDLEDRSWATGFTMSWQGTLSRSERSALHRVAADQSFRGQRAVPFSDSQPDLLAAYLAHDLGCALLRQVSGEYLVSLEQDDQRTVPLDGVVELVSNNLSGHQAMQITADTDRANAVLRGKAHHIDGNLYQYWITVAPTDSSSELPALSASAYVHLPGLHAGYSNQQAPPQPAAVFSPSLVAPSDADVLSSIRIVELSGAHACNTGSVTFQNQIRSGTRLQDWLDGCFALQVKTKEDAVVFFLNHQLNHGLVRLSGRDCSPRTEARIARADETLEYALPLLALTHDASSPATGWRLNPDADIYYAIAVSDSKAARALSRQLDQLPRRCTISVHPGLEGIRLENWLAKFSATVDQWQPHVDWQAIRVRNVF